METTTRKLEFLRDELTALAALRPLGPRAQILLDAAGVLNEVMEHAGTYAEAEEIR